MALFDPTRSTKSTGTSFECRWPAALRPGDRIGVAALSGPVTSENLERGLEAVRELGFEPVLATNLALGSQPRDRDTSLFAGSDAERLAGFHALVADPAIRSIWFARGGHGVLRLLPAIDWQLIARRPIAYLGYSDLTPLLLQITRRARLVTFHGPMVAVDLARGLLDGERESLLSALCEERPIELEVDPLPRVLAEHRSSAPLAEPRVVEAPLFGGCLSMLAATLGTEFCPFWRSSILFVEDVGEPLYRRDRMLTQLELAGCLAGCQALIAGHFEAEQPQEPGPREGCSAPPGAKDTAADWQDVLHELATRLDFAVAVGLEAGHGTPNRTLPLGAPARLDLDRRVLRISARPSVR